MDGVNQTSIPNLLRASFDENPNGLVITDRSLNILVSNRTFLKWAEAEDIVGTKLTNFLPEDIEASFVQFSDDSLDSSNTSSKFECQLANNLERWVSFSCSAVATNDSTDTHLLMMIADITEERNNLALNLEQQQMIGAIFLSSADGIISISGDGSVESFNPAAERIFGYRAEEIIGQNISILVPEDHRSEHNHYIENSEIHAPKIINRGRDLVGLRKDKSEVPIELNVSPMKVAGKKKFVGIVRDVTERKVSEHALRLSEARFRDFARSSADRFWETDRDHRFTYISAAPERHDRIPSEEMIGKTRWEMDTGNYNEKVWEQHRKDMDAHRPFSDIRYERQFSKGKTTYLSASGVPVFNTAGEFQGYRGTNVDITEQVLAANQAEDSRSRFLSALEFSPIGISFWDKDEKFVACNDQYRDVNREYADFLKPGVTYEEFVRLRASGWEKEREEQSGETIGQWVEKRLALFRQKNWEREYQRRGRWLKISSYKLPDKSTIVFTTDITHQREHSEKLRQTQKMEAVGQLTGGIAHDFNNLLAVVLGNLQLSLEATDQPEKIERRLTRALNAVQRGSALTQRLLAFSRQQALEPKSIRPGDLVFGMLDLLQLTLGESIKITTHFAADLDNVLVDPSQLENSILNLAINGRDAMPNGGELEISARNVEIVPNFEISLAPLEPGSYVKLSVTDDGLGMTQETLDHVFEPFYTTKNVGEGSGLGLSMVFGFVNQSGGHITIDSEPGRGTKVELYLPVTNVEFDDKSPQPEPKVIPSNNREKILLIEDDFDLREIISAQLTELGYVVIDGGDGEHFLDILHAYEDINMLLTDIVLPHGQNGIEIANKAVSLMPRLKVIVMTGYAEKGILESNATNLSFPVLQKPFEMAQLSTTIGEMLTE